MNIGYVNPNTFSPVLLCCLILIFSPPTFAQEARWIRSTDSLLIQLPKATSSPIFVIDQQESSVLFVKISDTSFRYNPRQFPLPAGQHELVVYQSADPRSSNEILRQSINILTPGGYQQASIKLDGDLSVATNIQQQSSQSSQSDTHATLQLSMTAALAKKDWQLSANANMLGVTKQEQALLFSQEQQQAKRIDLSDYLIQYRNNKLALALGHVSFAQQPLLIGGIDNRGISANFSLNPRMDLSITSQNGSAMVGWRNITGLRSSAHNISAATLGIDLLGDEQARLEISTIDANVQSIADFAVGEVTDVEHSQGWSANLTLQGFDQRLRAQASYASSRFGNGRDDALSEGLELVTLKSRTDHAYQLSISAKILSPKQQDDWPVALTLAAQHQRIDPLYKSISDFSSADTLSDSLTVNGQFGDITWQIKQQSTRDNLDNIPSLLTTKTQTIEYESQFNVASLFQRNNHLWLPSLKASHVAVHQYAINSPDKAISGFNGQSHLPDQKTRQTQLSLDWQLPKTAIEYSVNHSRINNLQTGRTLADINSLNHQLNVQRSWRSKHNIGFTLSRARHADIEQNMVSYSNGGIINSDFKLSQDTGLAITLAFSNEYDSIGRSKLKNLSADINFNQAMQLPLFGQPPLHGQWHLRYFMQHNNSHQPDFLLTQRSRRWSINAGLSLKF